MKNPNPDWQIIFETRVKILTQGERDPTPLEIEMATKEADDYVKGLAS